MRIHPVYHGSWLQARLLAPPLVTVLAAAGVCVALTSGSPSAAAAARTVCTWYAAPWGTTAAPGTKRGPFKTAQRLVDALHSGETGCLRGGIYTTPEDGLDIRSSGLTLRSYPGERARLHGTVYLLRANRVTLSHLDFVGDGTQNTVKIYSADVTIKDSDLTNNYLGRSCLMLGNPGAGLALRPRIVRNRFHECGRPANYNEDHAIYAGYVKGGKIADNVIYNATGYSVQLYPDAQGVTLEHNVIDGGAPSVRGGVVFGGDTDYSSNNNVLAFNIVAYAQSYNIGSWWGGAVGSRNVAHSNCVWAGTGGNISTTNGGFASTRNLSANPLFVNRAHHNFRLRARSRCLRVVGYDTAARLRRR
jgi:Right handed beta helix region